jgi:hypothetical protein
MKKSILITLTALSLYHGVSFFLAKTIEVNIKTQIQNRIELTDGAESLRG